ncbi:ComEC/Rec2 family competence protein [Alicyclobacillus sacchari]|uniref:ComEC/Rec2 family competence protein n=1 Tax=Alicyclobacillus sacchari TaxID=392010 RepID=UPI0024E16814|nr:ComEC/Rec2 family competence protein [Alicyclobacillus sacchari]
MVVVSLHHLPAGHVGRKLLRGVGGAFGLFLLWRRRQVGNWRFVLCTSAVALAASGYGLLYARICPGRPAAQPGEYTMVAGVIQSVTQKPRDTELLLEVTKEGVPQHPCRFHILALVPSSTVWQAGQSVRVEGIYVVSTAKNKSALDVLAPLWLFQGKAYPLQTGQGWFTNASNAALAAMQQTVSTAQDANAALAASIVIGRSAPIANATQSAFLAAGVAHLLAASGANVAFALRLALVPWRFAVGGAGRWQKTGRCVYALAVIWIFVALCGGALSIVRAAFAASYGILANWLGRSVGGGVTLTASCLLFAVSLPADMAEPSTLLSMFATFAVCEAADLIETPHTRTQDPNYKWQWRSCPGVLKRLLLILFHSIATSVVVDAYLLPIVWWMFGQWTPYSAIATTVLEPVASLLLPLTVIWAALSLCAGPFVQHSVLFDLAHACGCLDTDVVSFVTTVVQAIAHWKWSLVHMPALPFPAALAYVIAMAGCRRLHLPHIVNRRLRIESRVNRQTI